MSGKDRRRERAQARADSRRAQRIIQARQAKRRRLITMVGAVAGGAIIIAGLLFLFTLDSGSPAADEPVDEAPAPAAEVPTEGRTKGDPNAPVTVVEYGDFQ